MRKNGKNKAEKFVEIFNDVEKIIDQKGDFSKYIGFKKKIRQIINKNNDTSYILKNYEEELKIYSDIRNIIVHENKTYALPTEDTVNDFKNLFKEIKSPKKVYDVIKNKPKSYNTSDNILKIMKEMQDNNYSQVPIIDENNKFYGLLTNNAIARWVSDNIQEGGLSIDCNEKSAGEVYDKYTESKNNYKIKDKKTDIYEVIDLFKDVSEIEKETKAVFITENGKKTEKLLSIITIWDIPKIRKYVY